MDSPSGPLRERLGDGNICKYIARVEVTESKCEMSSEIDSEMAGRGEVLTYILLFEWYLCVSQVYFG